MNDLRWWRDQLKWWKDRQRLDRSEESAKRAAAAITLCLDNIARLMGR